MSNHDPMDRLLDEGRIKGATRMFAEDTRPEAVDQDKAAEVKSSVIDYLSNTGMSRTAVAKSLGIAGSTLGLVLNGSYPGNWQRIVLDLDRWLEEQLKRDASPKASTFVWTRVAEEVRTVADTASTLKTIGLVYGPNTSGVGKTMALEAIRQSKAGSILVTAEKATSTLSGIVRAIARAIPVSDSGATAVVYGRVKAKLSGTSRLLMVDQVHSLCGARDDLPLYALIDLYNATKAPQLWCGTSDIIGYLTRGVARGREPLAQIDSRICPRRDLMFRVGSDGGGDALYTVDEIRAVFAKGKMRLAPDAARYLAELANLPDAGALRTCSNLVVIATKVNEDEATVLTAAMLRAAHQMLIGSGYAQLEARMAALQPQSMLKVKAG